jgi:hypothetical protein
MVRKDGKRRDDLLDYQAFMTGWPTPMAGTPAQNGNSPAGNNDSSRKTVELAGWATPTAQMQRKSTRAMTPSTNNGRRSGGGQSSPPGLEQESEMAMGIIAPDVMRSGLPARWPPYPGPARLTVYGEMLTGSAARMESGGQLCPKHSLWLMLGPIGIEWARCAERVTRSTSRKRRNG